eukprot:TRINITY_DN28_c0_g1_i1.p1 TRINITY_DN28_c0_g1~~TRINITY_DN28_c0_g1_i1.p1  ORF type:complete len:382 (-),score=37.79 TRINITY_DN28_c0_g1_i1:96-1145(-)
MSDDRPENRSIRQCFRTLTAKQMTAEFLGTYIYVVFGLGAWASYSLTESLVGLGQVAFVWSFGAAIGMLIAWHTSGGHLNPVITLAHALFRYKRFPWWKCLYYIPAQFFGALLAGVTIFVTYYGAIQAWERRGNYRRDEREVDRIDMIFCNYFPEPRTSMTIDPYGTRVGVIVNPSADPYLPTTGTIGPGGALGIEIFCTALFVFIFFAFSDRKNRFLNRTSVGSWLSPIMIGLSIGLLIACWGPLIMVGLNPARDFGPRIIALLRGGYEHAIPAPRNGFWVYIVGPLIGALVGGFLYQFAFHLALPSEKDIRERYEDFYDVYDTPVSGSYVFKKKDDDSKDYRNDRRE